MSEPTRIPLKGLRGMIAARMAESVSTTARATLYSEADADALVARRAAIKAEGGAASLEDLLLMCVVQTLTRHPALNGTLSEQVITLRPAIDLGIAVALANGLVAPAIMGAQALSVEALSEARRDLVARAKTNKLTVAEMTGASFTVSNLGHYRIDHFTPLINIPQLAILGLGRIVNRPVARADGALGVTPMIALSLSIDHRAIDGAPAAAFLTDLARAIEER